MKVTELLIEVNLFPGLKSKRIDLSHWDKRITDAYIITLNDGRKMIRFDRANTINNDITQFKNEDHDIFRRRVKKTILFYKNMSDKQKDQASIRRSVERGQKGGIDGGDRIYSNLTKKTAVL